MRQLKAKRDANEASIIKFLLRCRCSVEQLSKGGLPDLLVGYQGQNLLLEVKSEKGKLTASQVAWHKQFKGTIFIVRSIRDAKDVLKYVNPK